MSRLREEAHGNGGRYSSVAEAIMAYDRKVLHLQAPIKIRLSGVVPPAALYLGKTVANFAMLLAVESVCLPAFGFFFNIAWTTYLRSLVMVILL